MGLRGPKADSAELQERKGNSARRQPAAKAMPLPTAFKRLPTAPKHLCPIAKTEWRRCGAALVEAGRLSPVNLRTFERYCQAYGGLRDVWSKIQTEGLLVETKFTKKANPLLAVQDKLTKEMTETLADLLGIETQNDTTPDDPLFDFLNRGKILRFTK